MTRCPPRPRPAPTASWPEANRSFFGEGDPPLAGAQRGSPSPKPTPSPNARYSGRWRLRMRNGLPSLTVPRHTTKTTIKKARAASRLRCKSGWSYGLEHASARPEKYLLENASCPTAGKKRRLRQEYGKIQRAQLIRPSRATSSFPPGHTPATPPLTKASFQRISPRPSPHTSGDRQQRLPAASRVTVKRPYERFLGNGGV